MASYWSETFPSWGGEAAAFVGEKFADAAVAVGDLGAAAVTALGRVVGLVVVAAAAVGQSLPGLDDRGEVTSVAYFGCLRRSRLLFEREFCTAAVGGCGTTCSLKSASDEVIPCTVPGCLQVGKLEDSFVPLALSLSVVEASASSVAGSVALATIDCVSTALSSWPAGCFLR